MLLPTINSSPIPTNAEENTESKNLSVGMIVLIVGIVIFVPLVLIIVAKVLERKYRRPQDPTKVIHPEESQRPKEADKAIALKNSGPPPEVKKATSRNKNLRIVFSAETG